MSKQKGFGLIESLITLVIIGSVFSGFMLVMLRSINAVTRSNIRAQMDIALDNRINNAWITCQDLDSLPLGEITFSINGTVLRAHNTRFNINQERVMTVN